MVDWNWCKNLHCENKVYSRSLYCDNCRTARDIKVVKREDIKRATIKCKQPDCNNWFVQSGARDFYCKACRESQKQNIKPIKKGRKSGITDQHRYTVVFDILKLEKEGVSVVEACARHDITQVTFIAWRKKFLKV